MILKLKLNWIPREDVRDWMNCFLEWYVPNQTGMVILNIKNTMPANNCENPTTILLARSSNGLANCDAAAADPT